MTPNCGEARGSLKRLSPYPNPSGVNPPSDRNIRNPARPIGKVAVVGEPAAKAAVGLISAEIARRDVLCGGYDRSGTSSFQCLDRRAVKLRMCLSQEPKDRPRVDKTLEQLGKSRRKKWLSVLVQL